MCAILRARRPEFKRENGLRDLVGTLDAGGSGRGTLERDGLKFWFTRS